MEFTKIVSTISFKKNIQKKINIIKVYIKYYFIKEYLIGYFKISEINYIKNKYYIENAKNYAVQYKYIYNQFLGSASKYTISRSS